MTTFIPSSTFGRNALRKALESNGSYVALQFLNVPTSTPGDRNTWTWSDNWSQYAIPGVYTAGVNALNLTSTGTGNGVITLWEEATSPAAGAYYDERPSEIPAVTYMNSSLDDITFTHLAVFTMQSGAAVNQPSLELTDANLAVVYPYNTETEEPETLAFQDLYYNAFLKGAINCSVYPSFAAWVAADEATQLDFFEDPPVYTSPYATQTFISEIEATILTTSYYTKAPTSAYLSTLQQSVLEVNSALGAPAFFAELLNVTSTEPDFEEGWDGWSVYRINRYSYVSATNNSIYESKEDSWLFDLGLIDPEQTGIYAEITWTGEQLNLKTPVDFLFNAPASGSYTYTHIAVFINEGSPALAQGSTYTYTNTDRFIGVIKLPASVTMSVGSTSRAYPFNLGVMFQPEFSTEILGS